MCIMVDDKHSLSLISSSSNSEKPRRKSIQIETKRRYMISTTHDIIEDIPYSRSAERFCNMATWRMYNRIMNVRKAKYMMSLRLDDTRDKRLQSDTPLNKGKWNSVTESTGHHHQIYCDDTNVEYQIPSLNHDRKEDSREQHLNLQDNDSLGQSVSHDHVLHHLENEEIFALEL